MAQKTNSQLTTEAEVIQNETVMGANTASRVGEMFVDIIDSKINNDDIDTNTSLGTSNTVVPSQNAVKTYVDNSIGAAYKVYTAVITQSGTNAPTVDYTLENTLSGTPTWAYAGVGQYTLTLSSQWTNNKTIVFINPGFMPSGFLNTGIALGWERNSSSTITIKSKNTSTGADANDLIFKASIEIRVYL
jgi:hypothetical protein